MGFGVERFDLSGAGSGVRGLRFGIWGEGVGAWGWGFRVGGLRFSVWGLGCRVWGWCLAFVYGFGVWGLGCGVHVLGGLNGCLVLTVGGVGFGCGVSVVSVVRSQGVGHRR